ncbi:MAG: hypothetical protein GY884_35825, partial [Proteobacteria bacterium]|nr:hypothetical protein [Pseudomonadota bacterium]
DELTDFVDAVPLVGGMMGLGFEPDHVEGPGWSVERGALLGRGQAGLHHLVPLGLPLTWSSSIRIGSGPAQPEAMHFRHSFLEESEARSVVIANRFQKVGFLGESGSVYDSTTASQDYFLDQPYDFHMEIDEQGAIVMSYEDEQAYTGTTIQAGPGLWGLGAVSNYPVGVLRVEISGSIDPATLGPLAEAWADAELTSLGL